MLDDAGNEIVTFGETPTATHNNVTSDTSLAAAKSGFNYGADPEVIGGFGPAFEVALIRFDVAALATSRRLVSAKLVVWFTTSAAAASFDVYAVNECWDEGVQNGNPGAASWNERSAGVPWTAPGAGVGSRETVSLAKFAPTSTGVGTIVFNDAGIAAIQGWIATPAANCGLVFVSSSGGTWAFRSHDNTAFVDERPVLALTLAR